MLPQTDPLGSNCLESATWGHLGFRHPRQSCWRCGDALRLSSTNLEYTVARIHQDLPKEIPWKGLENGVYSQVPWIRAFRGPDTVLQYSIQYQVPVEDKTAGPLFRTPTRLTVADRDLRRIPGWAHDSSFNIHEQASHSQFDLNQSTYITNTQHTHLPNCQRNPFKQPPNAHDTHRHGGMA